MPISRSICASQVSDKNPSVAPPLKVGLLADHRRVGWALLVSGKYLDKIGRDKKKTPRLLGFGHTTDYLPLDKKDAPTFFDRTQGSGASIRMANLKPRDLNGRRRASIVSQLPKSWSTKFSDCRAGQGRELGEKCRDYVDARRNENMKGKFAFELPVIRRRINRGWHPVGRPACDRL